MASSPKAPADPIDARLVRKLADILTDTGLSEIEVEHEGLKIRVAKTLMAAPVQLAAPAPMAIAAAPAVAAPAAAAHHRRSDRDAGVGDAGTGKGAAVGKGRKGRSAVHSGLRQVS